MKVGVVFPQTEIGPDPVDIKDFVQAVEDLGYDHLIIFDHVLGAVPRRADDPHESAMPEHPPYTHEHPFHEAVVLMGYLAAVTGRIELATGVLVLPQRQAALVAKQAAEIDLLSGGRLRLGVGNGWNAVEFGALGENFHDRGRRIEEQIDLLRRLWAEQVLEYHGTWHRVDRAGINPRPPRPVPIWLGGGHEAVLRRAARLADGFFPGFPPDAAGRAALERLRGYLQEVGRDPASFGIEGFTGYVPGEPDKWRRHADRWRDVQATHISVTTMNFGLQGPRDHIEAIRRYKETIG